MLIYVGHFTILIVPMFIFELLIVVLYLICEAWTSLKAFVKTLMFEPSIFISTSANSEDPSLDIPV